MSQEPSDPRIGPGSGWRPFGWAALIALFCLQAMALYGSPEVGPIDTGLFPGADKAAHLVGFAVPTLVAGLLRSRAALGVLLGHAVISELIQGAVTDHRVMDVWDAVANVAGWSLGLAIALIVNRRFGAQ